MNYELYSDVILLRDIPEEGLSRGDVGTIVEEHHVRGLETGYSVEFFDMLGNTVAVVTLPESSLRAPTRTDRPAVRLAEFAAWDNEMQTQLQEQLSPTDAAAILDRLPRRIQTALKNRAEEIEYPLEAVIEMAFASFLE